LRRETDHEKLHRIVQDAKRHGIETMLPDINVSSGEFSVDYEHNALRGSLREIKGVGKAAIDAIIKSRNKDGLFTDMVDFLKRVRGRAVNLKVVEALAIGGAFDELLPNIRWFVIGFRDLWEKYVTKENWDGLDDRILRSHNHMQWTSEERLIDAVEVNPLAMPPHPLISWESWIEDNVKFPLESIGSDLMAEERVVYIAGRITKIEDRAVGDSIEHEDMPDEQTQKSIGWDNPWAWVTLDSINEERVKVKIDWTIYDDAAGILDKGIGSLVLVCGTTNPEWRSINAHFVAELTSMADKLKRKAYNELSVAEQMFVRHPANAYKFKTKDHRRLAKKNLSDAIKTSNGSMRAIAVVSHLRTRIDRRGEEMAFFGLAGVDSYIDVVCFSSSWHEYKSHMKNGTFALFKLSKLDDGGLHLDSKRGGIHLFD
jgi:DNA polymerase III alpha subunit